MDHVEVGPVENLFGKPVFARRVACSITTRRDLRHVHDRLHAGLFRGLCELRRRLDQARPDRIDEVSSIDVLEGITDGIEIQQVADDDLRP